MVIFPTRRDTKEKPSSQGDSLGSPAAKPRPVMPTGERSALPVSSLIANGLQGQEANESRVA